MLPRSALRWIVAPLLLWVAACGTEPEHKTPPPAGLQPPNDTPQHAIQRLVAAYEQKKLAEYRGLFTGDFAFEFSTATDPSLVQQYAGGWSKADEDSSARHLFQGVMDDTTGYQPAARTIDLTLEKTIPSGDTLGPDSTKYKILATRLSGTFVIPSTGGQTEDTWFVLSYNFHRFFLVRGDAAVGLVADQPADDAHWYVYRWIDETAFLYSPAVSGTATKPLSWGWVKAFYR